MQQKVLFKIKKTIRQTEYVVGFITKPHGN
jgi:hypothetical protein